MIRVVSHRGRWSNSSGWWGFISNEFHPTGDSELIAKDDKSSSECSSYNVITNVQCTQSRVTSLIWLTSGPSVLQQVSITSPIYIAYLTIWITHGAPYQWCSVYYVLSSMAVSQHYVYGNRWTQLCIMPNHFSFSSKSFGKIDFHSNKALWYSTWIFLQFSTKTRFTSNRQIINAPCVFCGLCIWTSKILYSLGVILPWWSLVVNRRSHNPNWSWGVADLLMNLILGEDECTLHC